MNGTHHLLEQLDIAGAIAKLTHEIKEATEQRKIEFEWSKSHFGLATKHDLEQMEKHIMAGQAEIEAALAKVDAATTKLAANVQAIADVDQQISDEIDKF